MTRAILRSSLALLILLPACGKKADRSGATASDSKASTSDRGAPGAGDSVGAGATAPADGPTDGESKRAAEPAAPAPPAASLSREGGRDRAVRGEAGAAREGTAAEVDGDEAPRQRERFAPGQLTAGEWRDLDHWSFWRDLIDGQQKEGYASTIRDLEFDTGRRVPVRVVAGGRPVVDARVVLLDAQDRQIWLARTDNRGRAELFASASGNRAAGPLVVEARSGTATIRSSTLSAASLAGPQGTATVELELPSMPGATPRNLDLMFVVDTTGSMGDELAYLNAELRNVVSRVRDGGDQSLEIRTSVNFYKDRNDTYVVRSFPFESNLGTVLGQIEAQSAGGGGDFPEAVDAALEDAINEHQWSERARARLLFLVLDAPPHADKMGRVRKATEAAAARGIRIIPVVASGIDKPTEFLMRLLAISTGGTYLFLTDDSGIGGSHLKPTIGKYEVERLNDLLVKVISRYLEQA